MAFIENVLGGWTGGVVVGMGAAVFAPSIVPLAASVIRPAAKMLITGALMVSDTVSGIVADASVEASDAKRNRETRGETIHKMRPASSEH